MVLWIRTSTEGEECSRCHPPWLGLWVLRGARAPGGAEVAQPERGREVPEQGWEVPAHAPPCPARCGGGSAVFSRAEQLKPLLSVASPQVPALKFLLSEKSPVGPRAQRGGTRGSNLCSPPPARAADRDNRRESLPEPALSCQTPGQGSPSHTEREEEGIHEAALLAQLSGQGNRIRRSFPLIFQQ